MAQTQTQQLEDPIRTLYDTLDVIYPTAELTYMAADGTKGFRHVNFRGTNGKEVAAEWKPGSQIGLSLIDPDGTEHESYVDSYLGLFSRVYGFLGPA